MPAHPYKRILQVALILLGLLAMIALPGLITGYIEVQRGDQAISGGSHLIAARHYQTAARLLLWEPCLYEQAAHAALEAGDPQFALQLFAQASCCGRHLSLDGWVAFGDAYQQIGDLPSARAIWETALIFHDEDGEASSPARLYARLTHVYKSAGDFSAQEAALEHWLQLEPNNPDAYYQKGLFLAATQPEQALPDLMLAASLSPDLDASVQLLRTSLNAALLEENAAYRLVMAGRALGSLDEWSLATEAFHRATLIEPEYAEAWVWFGEASQHIGQDGLLYLEKALALKPESPMLNTMLGLYWQRQAEYAQALEALEKAVALEPENPAWWIALGEAYAQSGDLVKAENHYQVAVALDSRNPVYWRALAGFCVRYNVRVDDLGMQAGLWALALAPDDWQSLDLVGQAMVAMGNFEAAKSYFLRAIKVAPEQAAPHFHLGWLYIQTGELALAREYLEKSQTLDLYGVYDLQVKRLLEQYFPWEN